MQHPFNPRCFLGSKVSVAFLLCMMSPVLALPAAPSEDSSPVVHKVFLPPRLQAGNTGIKPLQPIDEAAWIWHPDFGNPVAPSHADFFSGGWSKPVFLRFRRQFEATASPIRIHVSADERFELFLDGQRIARGPDRSDVEHWTLRASVVAEASNCRQASPEFSSGTTRNKNSAAALTRLT
jgi:hypothetical protein